MDSIGNTDCEPTDPPKMIGHQWEDETCPRPRNQRSLLPECAVRKVRTRESAVYVTWLSVMVRVAIYHHRGIKVNVWVSMKIENRTSDDATLGLA